MRFRLRFRPSRRLSPRRSPPRALSFEGLSPSAPPSISVLSRISDTFRPRTPHSGASPDTLLDRVSKRCQTRLLFLRDTAHLRSYSHIQSWLESFLPYIDALSEAILPIINLLCFEYDCLYAELWRYNTATASFSLSNAYNRHATMSDNAAEVEYTLDALAAYTRNLGSISWRSDVIAPAMRRQAPLVTDDLTTCFKKREQYLRFVGVKAMFITPIGAAEHRPATHVLALYSTNSKHYRASELTTLLALLASQLGKYARMDSLAEESERSSEEQSVVIKGRYRVLRHS